MALTENFRDCSTLHYNAERKLLVNLYLEKLSFLINAWLLNNTDHYTILYSGHFGIFYIELGFREFVKRESTVNNVPTIYS